MEKILFGVAFGQLLAAAILVLLELFVSIAFWWLAERTWQTVQGCTRALIHRVALAWTSRR